MKLAEKYSNLITIDEVVVSTSDYIKKSPRDLALTFMAVLSAIFANALAAGADPVKTLDEGYEIVKKKLIDLYKDIDLDIGTEKNESHN